MEESLGPQVISVVGVPAVSHFAQVLVAALFSFFPVVVNGVAGLRAADPELGRALRTLGASRYEVWRRATLPADDLVKGFGSGPHCSSPAERARRLAHCLDRQISKYHARTKRR